MLLAALALPPAAASAESLQERLNRATAGERIEVPAGVYHEDLVIDRPVHVVGRGRPVLVGSGADSVVRIRASGVVFEGFEIDGRGRGDLGQDASGIHVSGERVTVRDCVIHDTLFGIYLRSANGAVLEYNRIRGIPGKLPGEKGSGIHVYDTTGFRLIGNVVERVRDGFYIQSSPNGFLAHNTARDLRYGLHYMFSDDNRFEDNLFERGDAGAALMYSRRITFARNRFVHNRGFASVGLLLKNVDDIVAEDNLIADNARGIVLDTSYRNVLTRNVIAESDVAIVLYDNCEQNRIERNSFVANFTPLSLVGLRTDTLIRWNYWSGNPEPDLDGDSLSDRPYTLTSVFDHFRDNVLAADLYAQTFAAEALGMAERAFPVLSPSRVHDLAPLAHPPVLPSVPSGRGTPRRWNPPGLIVSAIGLACGLSAQWRARRRLQ
jgi:nitrous oxidase accessory protein